MYANHPLFPGPFKCIIMKTAHSQNINEQSIVPKDLALYCTRFMELPAGFFGSSSSPGDHTVRCGSSLTLCGSGLRVAERSR